MSKLYFVTKNSKYNSSKESNEKENFLSVGDILNTTITFLKNKVKKILFNKDHFIVSENTTECGRVEIGLNPNFFNQNNKIKVFNFTEDPLASSSTPVGALNPTAFQLAFTIMNSGNSITILQDEICFINYTTLQGEVIQFLFNPGKGVYGDSFITLTENDFTQILKNNLIAVNKDNLGLISGIDFNTKIVEAYSPHLEFTQVTPGVVILKLSSAFLSSISSSVPVSSTVSGIVDNTNLQELGGKDKKINDITIGRGFSNDPTNTVVGKDSMYSTFNTGTNNTALGFSTLSNNQIGSFNVAIGPYSLFENTQGEQNVAIGAAALFDSNSTRNSVAIGHSALQNNSGNFNTAVGSNTGGNTMSGNYNILLGYFAGRSLDTGNNNILIEIANDLSTESVNTGNNNIVLNSSYGSGLRDGSNNVIIGGFQSTIQQNLNQSVVIGNGSGQIRIYTDEFGNTGLGPGFGTDPGSGYIIPTSVLHVKDSVRFENLNEEVLNDRVITSDSAGNLSYTSRVFSCIYTAVQSGTSNPVLYTILNQAGVSENNVRTAVGRYEITLSGTFLNISLYHIVATINQHNNADFGNSTVQAKIWTDNNIIYLATFSGGILSDNKLDHDICLNFYLK